jgi:cobalt-precorrin 5A hydrolase
VGLDGVCEPCALIACGRGRLVVPKTTLDGVAIAVVEDDWRFSA